MIALYSFRLIAWKFRLKIRIHHSRIHNCWNWYIASLYLIEMKFLVCELTRLMNDCKRQTNWKNIKRNERCLTRVSQGNETFFCLISPEFSFVIWWEWEILFEFDDWTDVKIVGAVGTTLIKVWRWAS